jgi:hypothetical protein
MITIYGASDDLIEVEGDIREEFNVYPENDTRYLIAISDGTLLKMWYDDDGIWRILRLSGNVDRFTKVEGDVVRDTVDIVTISGTIDWLVLGENVAYRKEA